MNMKDKNNLWFYVSSMEALVSILKRKIRQLEKQNEVQHGRWIWECYLPRCSECGMTSFHATNFCPHCGREMDGDSYV